MFKLELSEDMMNIIVQALANAPYRVAAPVLNEIQKQVNEQQSKPESVLRGLSGDGLQNANSTQG